MIDISGMTDKEKEMGTSTDTKTEGMTSIQFEKILGYLQGIPVFESDFVAEDTAVLINRKTGAGKIIEYEVRIHQLEKENKSLKESLADEVYKIAKEKNDEIEKLQWENEDLRELLHNAYGTRDEALANQVKLKKLLDKDRIIEILENWRDYKLYDFTIEQIAKEIIGNPEKGL